MGIPHHASGRVTVMKTIPLTRGQVTLVDDEDYERLSRVSWHCTAGGYAARGQWVSGSGGQRGLYMHREILGLSEGGACDHINGNRLDNRRANLRVATPLENSRNCKKHARTGGTHSRFKGVTRVKRERSRPWEARIVVRGRQIHLGSYSDESIAALAYDRAARKYFGEFAQLNFPVCADYSAVDAVMRCPTSSYRGVCWIPRLRRWRAMIGVQGKRMYLGTYADEAEAARVYDAAARRYLGGKARTNFPVAT